jgi:hypothetical protein
MQLDKLDPLVNKHQTLKEVFSACFVMAILEAKDQIVKHMNSMISTNHISDGILVEKIQKQNQDTSNLNSRAEQVRLSDRMEKIDLDILKNLPHLNFQSWQEPMA